MLGSEYNWLITRPRLTNRTPQVRMAGDGLLTLAIAAICLLTVLLNTA